MDSLASNDGASSGGGPTDADLSGSGRPGHQRPRPGMGFVGVGAFGELCVAHLRDHFDVHVYDPHRDLGEIADRYGVRAGDLATVASQRFVVLAMPLAAIDEVARGIAPHLRPGALVLDVCSIKTTPLAVLDGLLPPWVDIVGTHPLFGPQSGKHGIARLRVALCAVRGRRTGLVACFLRRVLRLEVLLTTAEEHDRQMAYVQGLTHLIARIVVAMDVPPLDQTTATFGHLLRMVETVRHDSDELFRAIAHENPFVEQVKARFFQAARDVEQSLASPASLKPPV